MICYKRWLFYRTTIELVRLEVWRPYIGGRIRVGSEMALPFFLIQISFCVGPKKIEDLRSRGNFLK
jgi:hypothetical protein